MHGEAIKRRKFIARSAARQPRGRGRRAGGAPGISLNRHLAMEAWPPIDEHSRNQLRYSHERASRVCCMRARRRFPRRNGSTASSTARKRTSTTRTSSPSMRSFLLGLCRAARLRDYPCGIFFRAPSAANAISGRVVAGSRRWEEVFLLRLGEVRGAAERILGRPLRQRFHFVLRTISRMQPRRISRQALIARPSSQSTALARRPARP